jgi:uncharacterized protein (DUF2141 family)
MNRFGIAAALILLSAASAAAQEAAVRLTVSGVKPSGGTVYAAVFDSSEGYRKNVPFRSLTLQPASPVLEAAVALPPGEYVFSLYQDLNSNGKLDTNFIGIPREPVGISNYDGKGPPGGFDRQKVRVPAGGMALEIRLIAINP